MSIFHQSARGVVTLLMWFLFPKIFFFFFLRPHLWHMEVPGPGVESELQLRPTSSHSNNWIWAASVTYTEACGNTPSLTHWERPEIEPTSSWKRCQSLNLLSHDGNFSLEFLLGLIKNKQGNLLIVEIFKHPQKKRMWYNELLCIHLALTAVHYWPQLFIHDPLPPLLWS